MENLIYRISIFSGATTTAPTLPEDEHATLPDEIKEEIVIEEKYIKEETKETTHEVVIASTVDEPIERLQPMKFEGPFPKIRDPISGRELNIKTPDEVQ